MAIRLNRFLAEAGLGSRRGVEGLIRDGRVRVNGTVVRELATSVDADADEVVVDGKTLRARSTTRMLMYNKPAGVISSFRSQGSSPCLSDVLAEPMRAGRLFHIGRLDKDSTGLLLLGDDGDLAHGITHPSRPIWKQYLVRVDAALTDAQLDRIRDGKITLDDRALAPARIRLRRRSPAGIEYEMSLREGRNRQIRRVFELFRSRVRALHRGAFGPLSLGSLALGSWRELNAKELKLLRAAAGLTSG